MRPAGNRDQYKNDLMVTVQTIKLNVLFVYSPNN